MERIRPLYGMGRSCRIQHILGATTGYNAASTEWGSTIAQRVAENHYFYNPENPDDPRTNINAKYPRMAYIDGYVQNRHGNTTLWLYKGDYIKLKNLSLGYTLPKNWVSKLLCKMHVFMFQLKIC